MDVPIQQLKVLQHRRDELLARAEIATLTHEIPQLERWASGLEDIARLADGTRLYEEVGRWVGNDPSFADPEYMARRITPLDMVGDRELGGDRLLFRSELDLARIRGFARILTNEIAPAIAVQRNLLNYIIGTNWQYEAEPEDKLESNAKLASAVDSFLQSWLKHNRWIGQKDREAYKRLNRDGETIVSLRPIEGGMSRAAFCEPSWLTEPARPRELEDWLHDQMPGLPDVPLSWTFGVVTPANDVEVPIGYHFVRDSTGRDWDFVSTSRIVHMKAVTDSNVKRGVSEYHPVYELIRGGEKVFIRTAQGAVVQASIAGVRQAAPTVRESQISGVMPVDQNRTQANQYGGRQIEQSHFDGVKFLTMSGNMQWVHGPMGTQRNPNLMLAGQASLRLAGVRWNMPEWMISGDASNNNFASSLVAESPFVKAAEAEQFTFSNYVEEMLWKAIRIAFDAGRFRSFNVDWPALVQSVKLSIMPTPVATRNVKELTDETVQLVNVGVLSRQTAAERHDQDWETEQQRMQDEIGSMVDAANAAGLGAGDL